MRLRLKKLLRGESGRSITSAMSLCADPVGVFDGGGRLVLGADPGADPQYHIISVEQQQLGEVRGGRGADVIATLIRHLGEREFEKIQLANETLGRYKELTLLYDMSDRLSRMFDLTDVAQTVVDEALKAIGGHQSALYLHDRRTDTLIAAAVASDTDTRVLPARSGVEGRVLRTGQAEFVEEIDTETRSTMDSEIHSLICAPLRQGERVVGVLRVAHNKAASWSSGDLKLVTSIAAQAAAALQGAELYRSRMRQVALRHHLERYVSPELHRAARQSIDGDVGGLALVFCDLSDAASVDQMEEDLTRATSILLSHRAVVDMPQGQMVLAAVVDTDPPTACRRAVDAGLALAALLSESRGEPPGVGVSSVPLDADPESFRQGLSTAALLQAASGGRVLVDYDVAASMGEAHSTLPVPDVDLPTQRAAFEVRP